MNLKDYFKYLPLPVLVMAYPILFLFGQNASTLPLGVLVFPLSVSLLAAWLVYTLFCLLLRKPLAASLATVIFVVGYYLYGSINHLLLKWNSFVAQPLVLLPLLLAWTVVAALLVARVRPAVASGIQRVLLVVSGALIIYNLFAVTVPVEAQKALAGRPAPASIPVTGGSNEKKPDIYYIIFDEYAGFDSTRGYFKDNSVDQFETFLEQNHFFVATGSRSNTINTGSEIASRLNLQPYPEKLPNQVKQNAIDNSKVMQILKANGYTTVAIDMAFPGINADETIQYDPAQVSGMAAEAYQKTFLNTTMFNAFSSYFQSNNQSAMKQRDLIQYSLDKTVNPGNIQSPKFVFTHVLLPHEPFIYDANGNLLPPEAHDNWNYYLGQHQYTTKLAEQLVRQLLAKADPNNPPVIILQSDHGARNLATLAADGTVLNVQLKNFSADDMHDILNALYLPGFNTSKLSNTMDPLDTFAIVLNHYLNAGVKVDPTPVNVNPPLVK